MNKGKILGTSFILLVRDFSFSMVVGISSPNEYDKSASLSASNKGSLRALLIGERKWSDGLVLIMLQN